jgi:PPM family protein phosphatase
MSDTRKLKNFEFGNATDVGRVREQNEDYMGYFETINGHVFVVCDGMGGHVGGATASRLAVDSVRNFLENHYFDLPQDALKESIIYANDAVYNKAVENPQLSGMGTTIVLVIIRDDKVFYGHVGDSRLYTHSGNKLCRLTSDHSYVQTLVDQGLITEAEMETHPRRNEILRALGVKSDVEAWVSPEPAKPGNTDTLLLCTDGLNSMISDTMIEDTLNESISVQHKALKLIQLANDAGGYDNTTVQLVNFYNVSNKKSHFVPASAASKEGNQTEVLSPKKAKMRKYFVYGVLGLSVLAILYFIWDMFIRSSAPAPLVSEKAQDTIKQEQVDTVKLKPAVNNNDKPLSRDTVWIDYTVKSGDALSKIGLKFNINIDLIKKKNHLTDNNIALGKVLKIPVRGEYKVREGDNADEIAKKFNANKAAMLRANGYKSDMDLKSGVSIYIPY